MSQFDKVIGYSAIKEELLQICDMIKNREIYEKLGAKMPRGILLHGAQGLGKTLMAKCFIEESGFCSYTVRKTKGKGDFLEEIALAFQHAKENAPAIVFLDDMDKFANEDSSRRDAEEYVAIQAGIDEVMDCEVFVFATANQLRKLPDSLVRAGRFDRKIEVQCPTQEDARAIIKHYLENKAVSETVDLDDVAMMIKYNSCAELETILNEAAINAAFARKKAITIDELVDVVLRREYHEQDENCELSAAEKYKVALHEAGHIVVSEVLCAGSVGLASVRSRGRDHKAGFVRRCKDLKTKDHILVALGGMAAVSLYFTEMDGCWSDIECAAGLIRDEITKAGVCGLGLVDIETHYTPGMSENLNVRNEAVTHAKLEHFMLKAKSILLENRNFLEKTAEKLAEKETLLYSDVQNLRELYSA